MDTASRVRAAAAAVRVDAGNAVLQGRLRERKAVIGLHLMNSAGVFDKCDLGHFGFLGR